MSGAEERVLPPAPPAAPCLDAVIAGLNADMDRRAELERTQVAARAELALQILEKARLVRRMPVRFWPAWSTGEWLMVGLVLNRLEALEAVGYTALEAIDRVDLDVITLRAIERRLQE